MNSPKKQTHLLRWVLCFLMLVPAFMTDGLAIDDGNRDVVRVLAFVAGAQWVFLLFVEDKTGEQCEAENSSDQICDEFHYFTPWLLA